MSRGDFGYGSTRTAYSDEPTGRLGPYTDEPFSGGAYQGALGRGRRAQERRPAGYSNANELSDKIGSNIFQINNNATTLDRALKQLGTNRDSTQLRQRVHTTEQNTNQVIAETAHFFKQYSQSCRGADRAQKLQFERLKNEFRETAQRYNSLQKELAQKVKSTTPVSQGPHPQQLISWTDDETRHSDRARLLEEEDQRRQQLQAQEVVIETDVALIQEREEQILQLEGDILDINEIFRDLATLVHEQGETINSIEDNVVMAHDQVGAGNEQLSQAAKYQKKARKKMCIIIIVLVVLAAIITLIVVLSVKK